MWGDGYWCTNQIRMQHQALWMAWKRFDISTTVWLQQKLVWQLRMSCFIQQVFRMLSDLISYHAIGARLVEDQEHRFVSSGISAPTGMKNPTSGNLSVMFNAIYVQHPQNFCSMPKQWKHQEILSSCDSSEAWMVVRIFQTTIMRFASGSKTL